MGKIKFYFIILIISTIYTSCFKEDDKIIVPATNGSIRTIELGENYDNHVYFSLDEDSIIVTNYTTDWDLSFECSQEGWHIMLNSSRFMLAANTHSTDFDSVFSLENHVWHWDNPIGSLDSLALNDWADFTDFENPVFSGIVYIIDRGSSQAGEPYGYKKLVLESMSNDAYTVRFANLDGTYEHTAIIAKDTTVSFVQFSFDINATISIEPTKNRWDLLFTRYTYAFYQGDPDAPFPFDTEYLLYPVTGVLLNRFQTQSTNAIEDVIYDLIDSTMFNDYPFNDDVDAIGWNWKQFTGTRYVIIPDRSYIIKNHFGSYFKLRFLGYYNDQGAKGYPKFEFERIKY